MSKEKHQQYIKSVSKNLWLPFTQMSDFDKDPLVIEKGEGLYLYDLEGKSYFDAFSSVWLNPLGHGISSIKEAISSQFEKLEHSTLLGMSNVPATELAEKLIQLTPANLSRVYYSDSGATSVEIGIKIAYQYWQNLGKKKKTEFIAMKNGYHGDTVGAISVGGIDLFHQVYAPLMFKSHKVPYPYPYRFEGSEEECSAASLKALEKLLKKRAHKIACLTIEPEMQGAGGMIRMPGNFLKEVELLCRKYQVLLLCDEVATGFGRTGQLFAVDHHQIKPDILTAGKMLTGGTLPVAVTLLSEEIYQAFYGDYGEFKAFYHGHSYTGNPLGCAAALQTLKLYEEQSVLAHMASTENAIEDSLEAIRQNTHIGEVRRLGYMCGMEVVKDKKTKTAWPITDRKAYKISLRLREKGVLTRPMGDVLVYLPPLVTDASTHQVILKKYLEAIEEEFH